MLSCDGLYKNKDMNDMEKYLNTTDSLDFVIPGMFDISKTTVIELYKIFCICGINYTDVYAKIYGEYQNSEFRREYNSYMFETISECYEFAEQLNEINSISDLISPAMHGAVSGSLKRNIEMLESISSIETVRKRSSSFINLHKKQIFEKHGNACLCCGSVYNVEMDHVIPVSMGGKNELDNMQPLCKKCNITKGVKHIDYRK